jgi:hypothetical protein
MQHAAELGIRPPEEMEGWADYFPRYTVLPWLKGHQHRRVQTMREYLRAAFNRVPIAADRRHLVTRMVHNAISLPARWRLDHDFYGLPIEIWLKNAAGRVFEPPKPCVDARQLATESLPDRRAPACAATSPGQTAG